MRVVTVASPILLVCFFCPTLCVFGQPPTATSIDAASFGAKADGTSDDTAAIQKALDVAGQQGGVVRLPARKYLVAGSLKIPEGVALVGCNQAPVYIEPLIGTVILAITSRKSASARLSSIASSRSTPQLRASLATTHRARRPASASREAACFSGASLARNSLATVSTKSLRRRPSVCCSWLRGSEPNRPSAA